MMIMYIVVNNEYNFSTETNLSSENSFEMKMLLSTTDKDDYDDENQNGIEKERYHLIFSTDCSAFQHWQSYLLFHSAFSVHQPGTITRIASGCSEEQAEAEKAWHQKHVTEIFGENFLLHLTPEFKNVKDKDGHSNDDDDNGDDDDDDDDDKDDKKDGIDYKYFNKPFGVKHWIENAIGFRKNGKEKTGILNNEDDIVILIDPDMILLRPITGDFSNSKDVIFTQKNRNRTTFKVAHGSPFAQKYLLGYYWQEMNLDKITEDPNSAAKSVNKQDGLLFYQVGPPYIATMRDMYQIVLKWTTYAPRVYAQYPELLAEMYAYCIAAADLKLPHTLVESLMVSNIDASGEGWPMVDALETDGICQSSKHLVTGDQSTQAHSVPSVIHFCQRYFLAHWFFSKYQHSTNIFECNAPLFEEPPGSLNVTQINWAIAPDQSRHKLDPLEAKRYAFVICALSAAVNAANTFFQKEHCKTTQKEIE
jgi:peptidyl serine alpha-galactosyltransferase